VTIRLTDISELPKQTKKLGRFVYKNKISFEKRTAYWNLEGRSRNKIQSNVAKLKWK